MDIDLLSKMVKELILDEDKVVLPGLGCFVAEIVPAYFSDKGYTINPPYRKLYFRARPEEGDSLVRFYAKSNGLAKEVAEKIIRDFVAELKTVLHSKKVVVFPGLGRLRATKENNVFFIADEDLDIYPEGLGLGPISLKTHKETVEEVSSAVVGLKSILTSEPAVEPAPEPEATPVPEPEPIVELEPEATPVPDPEPIVESEPETMPESVAEVEPVVEVVEEPEVEPVVEEPEIEFLVEPMPEPEVEPEAVSEQVEPVVIPEPEVVPVAPEPVVVPEPEVVPEPVAVISAVPATPAPERKGKVGKVLLIILAIIILLVAAYMAVGRLCPEWIDQFLYTPDELDIINR